MMVKNVAMIKAHQKFLIMQKRTSISMKIQKKGGMRVNKAGCLDRCTEGPVLVVYPDNIWYKYNSKDDIDEIINSHIVNNNIVERLKI